jgi:hypothetical protein
VGSLAHKALAAYHPVTLRALVGWSALRVAARLSALRLLPATTEPHELAAIRGLFPTATVALHASNRPGRRSGLVLDRTGRSLASIKLASDPEGIAELERRRRWIVELGALLGPPVSAPRVVHTEPGLLCCEAAEWRSCLRPWELPADVAAGLGEMYRRGGGDEKRGPAHGDFAPWNLLSLSSGGWMLIDWEDATTDGSPFQDPFHWIVQSHALLGRPGIRSLLNGLDGDGWIGRALRAYAARAGLQAVSLHMEFHAFLERTSEHLDIAGKRHHREAQARRDLLAAARRVRGSDREAGGG